MSRDVGNALNFRSLQGTAIFTPTGETGGTNLGDVIMYKMSPEVVIKSAKRHNRTGTAVETSHRTSEAKISYEVELQEATPENLAIRFLGDFTGSTTQASATGTTAQFTGVKKRRTYSLPHRGVSGLVLKVATVTKQLGTRDGQGTVSPSNADYIFDAVASTVEILEGGTIADASTIDLTYNVAAVTRDNITALTKPQRTGTLRIIGVNGSDPSQSAFEFSASGLLYPTNDGEENIEGEFNKFTLKFEVTGTPTISVAAA